MTTLDLKLNNQGKEQHIVSDEAGHVTIENLITIGQNKFYSKMTELSDGVEMYIKTSVGALVTENKERYTSNGLPAKAQASRLYKTKRDDFFNSIKKTPSSN